MRTRMLTVVIACLSVSIVWAQAPPAEGPEGDVAAAAAEGKLVYILFYRNPDPQTDAMANVIRATVAAHPDRAAWTAVRVTDPAQRALSETYHVTRAPTPLVLAVHPNGAVLGAHASRATQAQLEECFVGPTEAECIKLLQQDRLVLLCLKDSATQPLPRGVAEFAADRHFAERTEIVSLLLADPQEAAFLQQLEIDPRRAAGVTVFFAPPNVLVGTFAASVTGAVLADELAAASKCCDDENCEHNRRSQGRASQGGRDAR